MYLWWDAGGGHKTVDQCALKPVGQEDVMEAVRTQKIFGTNGFRLSDSCV